MESGGTHSRVGEGMGVEVGVDGVYNSTCRLLGCMVCGGYVLDVLQVEHRASYNLI